MGPNMVPNGTFIESTSRPPTPPAGTLVEEEGNQLIIAQLEKRNFIKVVSSQVKI